MRNPMQGHKCLYSKDQAISIRYFFDKFYKKCVKIVNFKADKAKFAKDKMS